MVQIDTSLVRRLLEEQFPHWSELALEAVVPQGWDNRTYRLGTDLLVRLPSAESYAAQVAKEQKWLPLLEPRLGVSIPSPVAMGRPGADYPWHWSIYRWLPGDVLGRSSLEYSVSVARSVADFLRDLQSVPTNDAPCAGQHNFWRGGPLSTYDAQTRSALDKLEGQIDIQSSEGVWEAALNATYDGPPCWVHGDMNANNLLVQGECLSGVIDFGCSAVGDPACDLVIAWTYFKGAARTEFKSRAPGDDAMWARARGWAIWKALITLSGDSAPNSQIADNSRQVLDDIIAEQR